MEPFGNVLIIGVPLEEAIPRLEGWVVLCGHSYGNKFIIYWVLLGVGVAHSIEVFQRCDLVGPIIGVHITDEKLTV